MLRLRLLGVHLERPRSGAPRAIHSSNMASSLVAACGVELDLHSELVVRARCRGPAAGPDDGQVVDAHHLG
eukprot:8622056-Alexandrium_andersonii.AAC.1